jgi:flagellar basal body-associated protein FliL
MSQEPSFDQTLNWANRSLQNKNHQARPKKSKMAIIYIIAAIVIVLLILWWIISLFTSKDPKEGIMLSKMNDPSFIIDPNSGDDI